jgi:hypothetical protein
VKKAIAALLAILCASAIAAEIAFPCRVARVEYVVDGRASRVALESLLAIDTSRSFADSAELDFYIAELTRVMRNNRVFEPSSSIEYFPSAAADAGDGPASIDLVVYAKEGLSAIVLPLPKYSSEDGFALSLRYRDYDFFGSLKPAFLNLDYYFSDTTLRLEGEAVQGWTALGGALSVTEAGKLELSPEGLGSSSLTLSAKESYPLKLAGASWSIGPYLRYGSPEGIAASQYLRASLGGGLSFGRVDWLGNFRKGLSLSLGEELRWHIIEASGGAGIDSAFSIEALAFDRFFDILGINARLMGRWYSDSSRFIPGYVEEIDYSNSLRGTAGPLYGSLAAIANVELPIIMAQGRFFGSDFLEAEVFLVPFVDAGFVSPDTLCLDGGIELQLWPRVARSFSYRFSAGYDVADYIETSVFDLGCLEIFMGLGTLF